MEKVEKIKFWLIFYPAVLIFSILSAIFKRYNLNGKAFVPETILTAAVIFTISVLGSHLAIYFKNKAAKLSHAELNKKIITGFILFLMFIVLISNVVVSIGGFVWYLINGLDLNNFLPNLFKYDLTYANKSLFIWFMFFSIAFFFTLWRKSSKKEQYLREENLKYRYQTLKSQVNPHFLFNSFNTLSELIYSDPGKADNYLQKLSGIYRHVLENGEKDLISLDDELKFVRQYFDLQKERESDKISLSIDAEDVKGYKIMPVSLQLLVENALKHNSMSYEKPLKIKITMQDDYIVVSNNIQRKNIFENSTRKGLQNLSERSKLILKKELIIIENNDMFIVKLPVSRAE
ncbi:MAG TPA: histidine kinase [Ignavibacteriaceae bacterium]|nr:histidine kinase [Ignavibacteriaceae bacterium]